MVFKSIFGFLLFGAVLAEPEYTQEQLNKAEKGF
jgi:hypothetical protein